jgi:hypothetical protein
MLSLSVEQNAVVVGVEADVSRVGELLRRQFGLAVIVEQSYGAGT